MRSVLNRLKGSFLHPQWLSDRYHHDSRKLLANIRPGCVIDIGSGDSDHAEHMVPQVDVLRFDYPDTNCRYKKMPHVYADAMHIPLADRSVDTVLLLEVIEHVAQFERVLSEIRRVLKDDGELYLSAPFIYPAHDEPYDFHRFTRHGLKCDLARHGLEIKIIKQHGNSFVVALQMINMSLLEVVKKSVNRSSLRGILIAMLCYPVCLVINFIALPVLGCNKHNASVFGHFLLAGPDHNHSDDL